MGGARARRRNRLNTWHALEAGTLPPLWAVVVGIGPVLLAVVLSHLVTLVLNDAPEQQARPMATAAATTATPPAAPVAPAPPSRASVVKSSRAVQAHGGALSGPGVHPSAHHRLAVVHSPRALPTHPAVATTSAAARLREDQGSIRGWSAWPRSCAAGPT